MPTDDDLFRTITYGVPGTSMPSWMGLSAADRWQLVYYLKSLIANFDQRQGKPISIPETWPVTVEMVDRGRAIYTTLQCSQCHGSDGRGDGPASDGLRDYRGDRAYPFDFGRAYKFKGGDSPRDLYRTLHTGLNGTPMKSFNGMLTERDTWSLVHFVRSLRVDGPRPNIVAEKDDGTSIGNARSLRVSIEKLQSQVEQTRAEAAKAQSDASAAKAILKQLLSKEAAEDRAAAEQAGREQASKDKAARDKAARARAAREQAAERRALAKEVRVIYRKRCAACHGPRGRGDGPAAPGLQPKPRNFSDPAWQKSVSNRTIERAIAQGGPAVGKSPVMPKSADLAKRPEVITQLRKLLRGFAR